jgi:hypothetical protein
MGHPLSIADCARARQHRYRNSARCLSPCGHCLMRCGSRVWKKSWCACGQTVLERREHMSVTVMPGVLSLLAYLKSRGQASGRSHRQPGADRMVEDRTRGAARLVQFRRVQRPPCSALRHDCQCARWARKLAGANVKVCVVGDTPSDIAAARANGLPTIAVATGVYSYDELLQHDPEVCVSRPLMPYCRSRKPLVKPSFSSDHCCFLRPQVGGPGLDFDPVSRKHFQERASTQRSLHCAALRSR